MYMRKLMAASLLGLVLVVSTAAPAFAIRDPFDPVISTTDTGTGTSTGTDTGGTQIGTNGDGGSTVLGGNQDSLANTGAETEPWLVAAYAAIAIGAGALAISKVARQPV